jgi:thymidylate synthase
VGEFIWTGGDCHLYLNHLGAADEQLTRQPLALPKLIIRRRAPTLFDYRFEDFEIAGYEAHPSIKAQIAV